MLLAFERRKSQGIEFTHLPHLDGEQIYFPKSLVLLSYPYRGPTNYAENLRSNPQPEKEATRIFNQVDRPTERLTWHITTRQNTDSYTDARRRSRSQLIPALKAPYRESTFRPFSPSINIHTVSAFIISLSLALDFSLRLRNLVELSGQLYIPLPWRPLKRVFSFRNSSKVIQTLNSIQFSF